MTVESADRLERRLGVFSLTNIVVANMIGAGIFTTSGLLISDLKSPLIMLLLWVAGGIIALCGALSYSELGAAMPHAGGEYVFLSKLYHPVLGFLSGWVSFIVGFSAPIAASSLGFSEYFFRAFPGLLFWSDPNGFLSAELAKRVTAIIVVALFTFVHLRGIVLGARIQNLLTVLKVALVVGLVAVGFAFGKGSAGNLLQGEPFVLDFGGWKTIGLSLMWIMFSYSGWNASTYVGAEINNPEVNLPRSLLIGTAIVMLLYLCLNVLFVYAVPPLEMSGVIAIGGLAAGNLFGSGAETLFSMLISFALFSSLSAFIILGPRVYYAMAKDGYFFRSFSEIHPKYGVPAKAIILQGCFSAVMVLSGTFDQILTYMGFSLGIFPLFAVMGVFKLRRRNTQVKVPGYPLVQVLYLLTGLFMLSLAFFERPAESSIALLTVLVGIPAFIFMHRGKVSARG